MKKILAITVTALALCGCDSRVYVRKNGDLVASVDVSDCFEFASIDSTETDGVLVVTVKYRRVK